MNEEREKKILIIGNNNEFLVRSVINDLNWRGFSIEEAGLTVTDVSKTDPSIKVYVLFIENTQGIQDRLVYLKDVSFEKKLYVCIVCNHIDVEEITGYISMEEIAALYERPVNIKEIGTSLDEIYQKSLTEGRRKSILIIDDDPTFLHKTQQLLKEKYKIFMANSAASALMVLSKHTVDLILLDYEMPIVSGPTAYEMIKAEPAVGDTPIMFLTGKMDKESVTNALKLKPVNYLTKTMPANELIAAISFFFVNNSLPQA